MDEKYEDSNYDPILEEEEEEYDEGYEGRMAQIEKGFDNIKGNPFSRELGPPEPFVEDRIVSADEIERIVIDETKPEVEEGLGQELQSEKADSIDDEFTFERITPEGEFKEVTEEQFKEGLAEDSFVEDSIEGVKIEQDAMVENYDQPELLQEWVDLYHSEQEQVLSPEATEQLQESIDLMDNIQEAVDAMGSLSEHVGSEVDTGLDVGIDTEFDSEMDSDEDSDIDMDMDGGQGSNI